MKGINTIRKGLGNLLALLLVFANIYPLNADDRKYVIVKSSDNSYFNQTIKTLISHVDDHSQFKVISNNALESSRETLQKANIVITLGMKSVGTVTLQSPDQLIINAYITLEQAQQFQHRIRNHIAVLLNQPYERYFVFIHELLNLKSLGTIYRSSPALNNRQQKFLKKLNLNLNRYPLGDTNKNLLSTLRQLIDKNEALLMLPEQSIYNRDTLKGILLTAYRSRTPVISYSPGHVKSGALAAIYSSPADIGRQLANLVNQHNQGRLNTNSEAIYAEYYSITTNKRVAHSLGLDLPDEEILRNLIDGSTK